MKAPFEELYTACLLWSKHFALTVLRYQELLYQKFNEMYEY